MQKKIRKIILIISILTIISCTNKINKENYDAITNGMTKSEVESILGKGESSASSNIDMGEYGENIHTEVLTWQKNMKVVTVTFSNDKVMIKQK
jgi:outer membrane protein assembly factor BamE (lipoprotein component of BamABCDE complex)